jgi:hypothetical protein
VFKQKKHPKIDDSATRHQDLPARLAAAEARLISIRAEATAAASCNSDKLAVLAESAAKIEFEVAALRAAIEQADRERAEAEDVKRREADKRQRQQTAHDLRKLAVDLEKALAPLPDAMRALQGAIAAVLPIVGHNGFPDLLGNLAVEVPAAVEGFVAEIRARADQTIAGTAPPTLPPPPVLTAIEEPPKMPETTVVTLQRLSWSVGGRRRDCGPYQIIALPTEKANIALTRGLALRPDSDRYRQMRAEAQRTGWPHLLDANKTYDLDLPESAEAVYSFGSGKKLRDEPAQTFTPFDRGPARQVFVNRPEV